MSLSLIKCDIPTGAYTMIDATWVTAIATIIYTIGIFLLGGRRKTLYENSFKLSFLQSFERIGKDIMTGGVPPQKVGMHRAYRIAEEGISKRICFFPQKIGRRKKTRQHHGDGKESRDR
jgi:hypothetical protein